VRSEVKEWIKVQTTAANNAKKSTSSSKAENHDAFEWLVVHVVLPNTAAATQPRYTGSKGNADFNPDLTLTKTNSTTSRWRGGSTPLLEKMKNDFNITGKTAVDRVAQIRIGINDLPYDMLPRVVPAVPTGYTETEQDAENAWADLITKFKTLILSSFDLRVSQYEEDIKENETRRSLPGWNFCTFFMLKEGLARGFESVGLVEDALVGYDELSVGLDVVIKQQTDAGSAEAHGGALFSYTEELRKLAQKAVTQLTAGNMEFDDDEAVDLQSSEDAFLDQFKDIPISPTKKPYRDLILENKVSVFDFRCYIFARQISLLLRLGNAWSTREELLAKLREQQDSVMHMAGVAPRVPKPKPTDESENLTMLSEICRRTLQFIPAVSQIMRQDIINAMTPQRDPYGEQEDVQEPYVDPVVSECIDNIIASFAFAVAQQILAQTSTKALPIPPSILTPTDGQEPKASIPEPKTMMLPARQSSLSMRAPPGRAPPSPNVFSHPGHNGSVSHADLSNNQFLKAGLEELAARRAELYTLSRNILEECGKRRGWSDGWASVPVVGETDVVDMVDISFDAETQPPPPTPMKASFMSTSPAGITNDLLRTALDNRDDFYRLYEILTDKALRHYTVANYDHSVNTNFADLAVLKYHLQDFVAAASFYYRATPFYGESGWSLLELSMLVMYSRCLKEMKKMEDYVTVLKKLLTKAAAAEQDRLRQRSSLRLTSSKDDYPDQANLQGFLSDLLSASETLQKEVEIPLTSFFCDIEIDGPPGHDEGQDSFSLTLKLRSLLAEDFELQRGSLKLASPAVGGLKEIWLQSTEATVLKPGVNKVQLCSNTTIPGAYEVVQLALSAAKVKLHYERSFGQAADKSLTVLRNPKVSLYQRASSLDVQLSMSKDIQLDKNNTLELEVLSGWNEITGCEVRIKAATGGMRLLMAEAKVLGDVKPSKKPEGGFFVFGSLAAQSSVKVSFPFTVETDLLAVSVKVEVAYTTERGSFTFSKTPSVPIALALAVNVQDVFKHNALFSKFAVSTGSSSPLRLYKSELWESDVFESHFGVPPADPVMVFSKQPASLLYKITRKKDSKVGPKTKKTMYLKLHYSVLLDEVEETVKASLKEALHKTELGEYSKLVMSSVMVHVRKSLTDSELERCALLGVIRTSPLSNINWADSFSALGKANGQEIATSLSDFVLSWQRSNKTLHLTPPSPGPDVRTILIPVDIPTVTIVHTADIRLHSSDAGDDTDTVVINQLLSATLHLKWTRIWDTGDPDPIRSLPSTPASKAGPSPHFSSDLEFSYEINAPSDTWLLGGRRKGHFVIPANELTSTSETEAEIGLVMVPLREGSLPFPSVEIREVRDTDGSKDGKAKGQEGDGGYGQCETDARNMGETVDVVADRARVTLSLDASGAGGGPLVLESEMLGLGGRVVA
jgi:hypothetical protein